MAAAPAYGRPVKVPAGSEVYTTLTGKPSIIRKERFGVALGEPDADGGIWVQGRRGDFWAADWEVLAEGNHVLHMTKFNRGGHPIAGWNWPMWGYRYKCNCGAHMGEDDAADARESHEYHLASLAS